MICILLLFPMFRSLQLLFRLGRSESSTWLIAPLGRRLATSVSLFENYPNFARRPSNTLIGHLSPTPLESAHPKIVPITPLESALPKTQDLKPFGICTYEKTGGREA